MDDKEQIEQLKKQVAKLEKENQKLRKWLEEVEDSVESSKWDTNPQLCPEKFKLRG